MSNTKDPFVSIDDSDLQKVAGGANRVASGGSTSDVNDQLMLMLTQIGDSIKQLSQGNGGTDMTTMMMMMMMMGGGGGGVGGGGGFAASPLAPAVPQYIDVGVAGGGYGGLGGGYGGGCPRGKKGW